MLPIPGWPMYYSYRSEPLDWKQPSVTVVTECDTGLNPWIETTHSRYSKGSFDTAGVTFAASLLSRNGRATQAEIELETETNGRQSKMVTWEWEDGETGLIRTIKIPMPKP